MCALFIWSAVSEVLDLGYWKRQRTLNYDIETYYHYLPSTLIHGDPLDLGYVAALDSTVLHPGEGQRAHGMSLHPSTGHHVNKCTYGVALMELPFFLGAHAATIAFAPGIADGYSAPYQLAVSLSAIASTLLGLLLLRVFLRRYTDDRATAISLIILAFGTNLFFYSTVDSGMPHSYLFLLFALVLERTDAWHRRPSYRSAAAIGLAIGATALIRPVDVIIVCIPLMWPVLVPGSTKRGLIVDNIGMWLLAGLCALMPLLPQFLYWKTATGDAFYWSYGDEHFNWSDPHLLDGLFSYRKGWFVYTPLALIGFAGLGLMVARKGQRAFAWPIILFFTITLYITFCWHQWWYGGSFGCRPLVGSLALLALPMALLTERIMRVPKAFIAVFALAMLAGIHLNLFQQRQYVQTIIHWDSMSRERYREVWGHANWDGLREFP